MHSRSWAQTQGKIVPGLGFDRNVLIEAGMRPLKVCAASSSTNANIVASHSAQYLPRAESSGAALRSCAAEVYQRREINDISTAHPGGRKESLKSSRTLILMSCMSSGMEAQHLSKVEVPARLNGIRRTDEYPRRGVVTAITRNAHTFIPVSA